MNTRLIAPITAFSELEICASGPKIEVVLALKSAITKDPNFQFLCFDDSTGQQLDFDLSGSSTDIILRYSQQTDAAPPTINAESDNRDDKKIGRPKLGVQAKEITLLPRHWLWLSKQSGGASATIRRLVEQAMRANQSNSIRKSCQEAAYRFLTAIAGNLPNYEEALRAIFRDDAKHLSQLTAEWPSDIVLYMNKLFIGTESNIDCEAQ